jgi:hypothetical protein
MLEFDSLSLLSGITLKLLFMQHRTHVLYINILIMRIIILRLLIIIRLNIYHSFKNENGAKKNIWMPLLHADLW